ncbi:MAG: hypothetical protein HYV07_22460 [Deltaproteobacteria bacterium]|nr:hypothetical protein [Deltaproteobacteria bacterium]
MRRTPRADAHGFALIVVFIILAFLSMLGLFWARTAASYMRETGRAKKGAMLTSVAEAGVGRRISALAVATDDVNAAIDLTAENQTWPPASTFTGQTDLTGLWMYNVSSQIRSVGEGRPPPGVEVDRGGQTLVFEIASVGVDLSVEAGERTVSSGAKLYSRSGRSYNR